MAKKKKRVRRKKKPQTKSTRKTRRKSTEVSLPTERSKPADSLRDYVWLLYGEKKIGKTTLAAQFPNAFFLMFEPGGRALEIFQESVTEWTQFVGFVDALEEEPERFDTVVVDTVDLAYEACFDYMCTKLAITHPHDENDYGKSWGQIEKEFITQVNRLMALPSGTIFISHAKTREVRTRKGGEFDRVETSMAKQAQRHLEGVVDIWAYYGYSDTERRLLVQGSDYIGAGNRLQQRFQTPNGERLVSIPMGDSAEEAFRNVQRAFNNKQKEVGEEALEVFGRRS